MSRIEGAVPTERRLVFINPSDTRHSELDEVDGVSVSSIISIIYHLILVQINLERRLLKNSMKNHSLVLISAI